MFVAGPSHSPNNVKIESMYIVHCMFCWLTGLNKKNYLQMNFQNKAKGYVLVIAVVIVVILITLERTSFHQHSITAIILPQVPPFQERWRNTSSRSPASEKIPSNKSLQTHPSVSSSTTSSQAPSPTHPSISSLIDSSVSTSSGTECSTLHVAMVVHNLTASVDFYTSIKSIVMQRSTLLHFHIIANQQGRVILGKIFQTWMLHGVQHSFYDIDEAFTTAPSSLVKTKCPSSVPIHFNLHTILPDSIDDIMVLEPTSIVKLDLVRLQSVVTSRSEHVLSVCKEVCVSYCQKMAEKGQRNWGAFGLNLHLLRQSSFESVSPLLETIVSQLCAPPAAVYVDKEILNTSPLPGTPQEETLCSTVQNYNGELLRHKTLDCAGSDTKPLVREAPPTGKVCEHLSWERDTLRIQIPHILGHIYTSLNKYDVTLVNHIDFNRINLLERSFTNWDGPGSIAIQVNESEAHEAVKYIFNSKLWNRTNVTYHLMLKTGPSYPINALRELGREFCATPYIFNSDIDFVSSPSLYQVIVQDIKDLGDDKKVAPIVPAFETRVKNFKNPRNRTEMVQLMDNGTVFQVHADSFFPGHGATDFKKWRNATEPYYIKYVHPYEPFTVLPKVSIRFDPLFIGRFRDKNLHNAEVHMAGYKFLVLSEAYIIHLPHPVNTQNMKALGKCSLKWCYDWIKQKKKYYHYTKKDIPDKECT